jgi:hypothetical protein
MHWHDDKTSQKKPASPKWVGLFLGLALSVFLVGRLSGWWQTTVPDQSKETMITNVETAVPFTASPTPLLIAESAPDAPDFNLPDQF